MFRRSAALLLLPVALLGCARVYGVDTSAPQQAQVQAAPVVPAPAPQPQFDVLATMNDVPGVTVYPLNSPPSDPFTRKNLQPLSQKVIGEGFLVSDPSVNVYPPRLPQAIPAVAPMQGVRVDAASALYSGKIRAQGPAKTVMVEQAVEGQPLDDMSGGVIAAQPLPPVIGETQVQAGGAPAGGWGGMDNAAPMQQQQPAAVNNGGWGSQPSLLAAPQHAFTQAGTKSGPVGTGYGAMPPISTPNAPVAMQQPVEQAPPPVSHVAPQPGPVMQPPTDFFKQQPSPQGVIATPAPSLPAAPQGNVQQSALPSLTGY